MKEILFLHDPLSTMPDTRLSSLVNLAKADGSQIKVLLPGKPFFYSDTTYYYGDPIIPIAASAPATEPDATELKRQMEQAGELQMKESLRALESTFTQAGVPFSCSTAGISLAELLKQSAYADLVVADALLNVPGPFHPSLNISVSDLLADAHCPVLLLRQGDMPPDRIMLSYDGSLSSMQAIRSFSYLFPELRAVPCFIVYVSGDEQREPDDLPYLKNWLPLHFDDYTVEILPGEPAEVLPAFAGKEQDSTLVVMGAYGRSALSRLFRQSLANSILEKANASLFVTHEH
jgi:nucleotide-binding universal stress UspA family protein